MTENRKEYLRRNNIVCKAQGIEAGLGYILNRAPKRTPKWMLTILEQELVKSGDVRAEVVKHRSEVQP